MIPATHGWVLLDLSDNKYYRIIAWTCSQDGNVVSPVVVDNEGGVGIIPISTSSHRVYYDPRTFETI